MLKLFIYFIMILKYMLLHIMKDLNKNIIKIFAMMYLLYYFCDAVAIERGRENSKTINKGLATKHCSNNRIAYTRAADGNKNF